MKIIRKKTRDGDDQIFEILHSRKEAAQWLKDLDIRTGKQWLDEDNTIYIYDSSGGFYDISAGQTIPSFNRAKIKKLCGICDASTTIYGNVPIVWNEKYGDWDIDF